MSKVVVKKDVVLPVISDEDSEFLIEVTNALSVPRSVLASNDEISQVWQQLPRHLKLVPLTYRNQLLARLCIAARTGLFDAAINYIWNIGIVCLRDKIKTFGLRIVGQIKSKDFAEKHLLDLTDADLLDLCLELNLISEEGYFFLDQCRTIRNNFSVAHPAAGQIDDSELLSFINRIVKHALNSESNHQGVDVTKLIEAVRRERFTKTQLEHWIDSISKTFEIQKKAILGTMHGIYCDPGQNEESRMNALSISKGLSEMVSPDTISDIVARHSEYVGAGDEPRQLASTNFFEKVGALSYLNDHEKHLIVYKATRSLLSAHLGLNNFYNEPPFAERLFEISEQISIPITVKHDYVQAVTLGFVGNGYGVSSSAVPFYEKMIKNFKPKEIAIMFDMSDKAETKVNRQIQKKHSKDRFAELVEIIDGNSVPTKYKTQYSRWIL